MSVRDLVIDACWNGSIILNSHGQFPIHIDGCRELLKSGRIFQWIRTIDLDLPDDRIRSWIRICITDLRSDEVLVCFIRKDDLNLFSIQDLVHFVVSVSESSVIICDQLIADHDRTRWIRFPVINGPIQSSDLFVPDLCTHQLASLDVQGAISWDLVFQIDPIVFHGLGRETCAPSLTCYCIYKRVTHTSSSPPVVYFGTWIFDPVLLACTWL